MGKGGAVAAEQQVNEYNMSIHFGICAELDAITAVYVGEKQAWSGNVTAEAAIAIDRPDLFGGPKKEGGVRGVAYYLPGNKTQVLPTGLAVRRGLTFLTSPAYRGLASVYFVGATAGFAPVANGGRPGFYWGATPYLQSVWITGRRAPKGLNPAYAMVGNQLAAQISGYAVTVAGVSATVSDGVTTLVGGHSIRVSVRAEGVREIVLDGLTVVVKPFVEDEDGDHHSGTTVAVEGNEAVMENGQITLSGVTITQSASGAIGIAMGSANGVDANAGHIIYECLTNVTWGMGAFSGLIDRRGFEAAGQVLYHEGFGLSIQWTRESAIEDFINEILDHIQGALYVDPDTGKLTLKLFRDDYDATTLPLISPDNAVLDDFQRKLWGETVNEVIVSWTNPANEQEQTITQQDLGNITLQGATISTSRNYYGVRNGDLATRLAIRDVRQSAAPLASVEVLLDRSQWNLKPGSVVRVTWPEYEIENLVMRVVNIDYGKIGTPSITATLLEDIFSLEDAAFDAAPSTGFVDSAEAPSPMNHATVFTAPAYFTSRALSAAEAASRTYPSVLATVLAATDNTDVSFYELIGLAHDATGAAVSQRRGTRNPLGWKALAAPLLQEATTVVPAFGSVTRGVGPMVGGFLFIGGGTERTMEIALIESVDVDGWHLQRGVLDTVPRAWAAGTPVWFYDGGNAIFDDASHGDGEEPVFKLQTITSLGTLPLDDAPVIGAELTGRPYLPNRPANVLVNGVAFGAIDLSGMTPAPSTIPISWANRNRTMEDNTVVRWTDANVAPESGQTTTIRLTDTGTGATIATFDGLTGTAYDLPVSAFAGHYEADLHFTAKRDGFESLQHVVRRVRVAVNAVPLVDPGNGAPDAPYTPAPVTFPRL